MSKRPRSALAKQANCNRPCGVSDVLFLIRELVLPRLPLPDIGSWYSTCRQFAFAWLDLNFVITQLQTSMECARALYSDTLCARYYNRIACYDCTILGLHMARYVITTLLPRALSYVHDLEMPAPLSPGPTVRDMLATVCDTRVQALLADESEIFMPGRIQAAFYIACGYIEDRYGWFLAYRSLGEPDRLDACLKLRSVPP